MTQWRFDTAYYIMSRRCSDRVMSLLSWPCDAVWHTMWHRDMTQHSTVEHDPMTVTRYVTTWPLRCMGGTVYFRLFLSHFLFLLLFLSGSSLFSLCIDLLNCFVLSLYYCSNWFYFFPRFLSHFFRSSFYSCRFFFLSIFSPSLPPFLSFFSTTPFTSYYSLFPIFTTQTISPWRMNEGKVVVNPASTIFDLLMNEFPRYEWKFVYIRDTEWNWGGWRVERLGVERVLWVEGGWGSITQCPTSCDGLRQGDLSGVVASITIRDRDKADKEW